MYQQADRTRREVIDTQRLILQAEIRAWQAALEILSEPDSKEAREKADATLARLSAEIDELNNDCYKRAVTS